MKKTIVFLLAIFLISVLAACGSIGGTKLSGEEKDAVLAFSESKTDNLMAGMNAKDYAAFSKDFDEGMKTAMSEEQFKILKRDRDAKLGPYISRQVRDVYRRGDYFTVSYNTVFEADDAVVMRVVFQAAEPNGISGLWFDK